MRRRAITFAGEDALMRADVLNDVLHMVMRAYNMTLDQAFPGINDGTP